MRITPIQVERFGGLLGLCSCPGRSESTIDTVVRRRLLEGDIEAIREWRAKGLVSVLDDEELRTLHIEDVGATATRAGVWWFRIPIRDGKSPDTRFRHAWPNAAAAVLQMLRRGQRIAIHSAASDGRAGLVACCLLIELGLQPAQALDAVRKVQLEKVSYGVEQFVHEYIPRFSEHTRLISPKPESK